MDMYSDDDQPIRLSPAASKRNGHVASNGNGKAASSSSFSEDEDMPLVCLGNIFNVCIYRR